MKKAKDFFLTKDEIEKSVLAFCGQNGLFPLDNGSFADRGEQTKNAAVFGRESESHRHVVAAVSGGADSMALLNILLAVAPQLSLTVTACHVNHGMRGETADRDERFVRGECARLGVPLDVCSAKADGVSVPENAGEDWARKLRYSYFNGYAAEGRVLVATAHTLSDQAETLLFRLARGTGAHGAAGIRPKRGMFIRPLLCLTREDTEAYCRAIGQSYVTDETNLADEYARNRIRHTAMPALTAANERAVLNMGSFCRRMAQVDDFLSVSAHRLLESAAAPLHGGVDNGPWKLSVLQSAEPLILETALHSLVSPERDAEEKYIRLLRACVESGSGAVQLTDSVRFAVRGERMERIEETARDMTQQAPELAGEQPAEAAFSYPLAPGKYEFGSGYCVKIEIVKKDLSEKTQSVHKKDLKNVADYAKIPLLTVFRTRLPGDTFRPAGRGVGKTLKKLQNEQKIPERERYCEPLLAEGSRVLWLWNYGFADGLAPDGNTREVLRITQIAQKEESGI